MAKARIAHLQGPQSPGVVSKPEQTMSTLAKVFSNPDDLQLTKPEVMGLLMGVKVLVAIVAGVACGLLPVYGALGFALYGASSVGLSFLVYRSFLGVDEEEMGGHVALLGEDQNISFPLFMLTWILTFSSVWW